MHVSGAVSVSPAVIRCVTGRAGVQPLPMQDRLSAPRRARARATRGTMVGRPREIQPKRQFPFYFYFFFSFFLLQFLI
jgi:hypothetical protein